MKTFQTVISLSGGMDSATLLKYAIDQCGSGVLAVNFTYGSKHNKYEQACAKELVQRFSVVMHEIDLTMVGARLKSNLLLSGNAIPEGHYQSENMKLTVVPGRNLIFASVLAGIAESVGAGVIMLGVHSGDHAIYPDCRPGFIKALQTVVSESTEGRVRVEAPFLSWDKAKILRYGIPAGVPYELTRTCYKDQPIACGKCGSCQERLEAFRIIGTADRIPYETTE